VLAQTRELNHVFLKRNHSILFVSLGRFTFSFVSYNHIEIKTSLSVPTGGYLVIKTAHFRCICAATCFRLLHGCICLAVSMISEENIVRLIVSLEKESVRQHGIDTTNIIRIWLVVLHLDEVSIRLWTLFFSVHSFFYLERERTYVRIVNDFFPKK
jgi:hypothetical protein